MFPAGISDGRSGGETGGRWPRKADPRQSDYAQSGKVGHCRLDFCALLIGSGRRFSLLGG